MKKKKSIWKNHLVMGIFIIALIVVLFGILVVDFNKFNPDTDECDTWQNKMFVDTGDLDKWKPDRCDQPTTDLERYYPVHIECYKCLEWHPKSKCELNPNDEECVCDEYLGSTSCKWKIGNVSQECLDNKDRCTWEEVQKVNSYTECWSTCIKAHEQTIKDLSCPELKDYYLNGGYNCSGGFFETCIQKYPKAYNSNILFEYLDGCK